jgi:hypothetical protein
LVTVPWSEFGTTGIRLVRSVWSVFIYPVGLLPPDACASARSFAQSTFAIGLICGVVTVETGGFEATVLAV